MKWLLHRSGFLVFNMTSCSTPVWKLFCWDIAFAEPTNLFHKQWLLWEAFRKRKSSGCSLCCPAFAGVVIDPDPQLRLWLSASCVALAAVNACCFCTRTAEIGQRRKMTAGVFLWALDFTGDDLMKRPWMEWFFTMISERNSEWPLLTRQNNQTNFSTFPLFHVSCCSEHLSDVIKNQEIKILVWKGQEKGVQNSEKPHS